MIPKVRVVLGEVKDYLGILEYFVLSDNMFRKGCLSQYPKFKEILKKSKNEKEDLRLFFESFNKKNKKKLQKLVEKTKKAWAPLNNKIMKAFEDLHQIKWTKKHSNFTARITLCPVCPRYLEYNAFDVYYRFNEKRIIDTFLHELSHFIFFEKLKKVYPKINSKEFEHPHLIWKMSEVMPGIILQDKKIQEIYKNKEISVYDNIKKIKIEGKLLLEIFQKFYDERNDFESFIKKSYGFIKKHKKEFERQF
ncbi:hypothetical protein HOA55_04895 [archaeon]|jgi:hypothetical protein|nr:hypothetical protein [archaeon]MBT3578117.1 hypothetical protein [archaeon]MBT6820665.1 hypothetical protein [archaeon]MBT6955690.1 hypothetical protein [archaeon]MBT7024925.1 hypothetical protein [archaeon]